MFTFHVSFLQCFLFQAALEISLNLKMSAKTFPVFEFSRLLRRVAFGLTERSGAFSILHKSFKDSIFTRYLSDKDFEYQIRKTLADALMTQPYSEWKASQVSFARYQVAKMRPIKYVSN